MVKINELSFKHKRISCMMVKKKKVKKKKIVGYEPFHFF